MKFAKGGLPWILAALMITIFFIVITALLNRQIKNFMIFISILFFLKSFFLIIFFRDPERKTGKDIVAVADGLIREITEEEDKDVGKSTKISTFMNFYNVHVNRMPLDGKIKNIIHYKGAHTPAFRKESEKNERLVLLIDTDLGILKIVQIAGTLARRIIPYVKKGDIVKKGEKIGLIRLGSRVDVYLPKNKIKSITVMFKDRIKAGEDTIDEIND